jgi:molybdate transport system substrate-binding protein
VTSKAMRALPRLLLGVVLVLTAARGAAAAAEAVAVAAAANLTFVLAPLDQEFERMNPGVTVTSEVGASGSLVAQITNGAPYDVFLSADMEFPRKLIAAGGAQATSLVTFAYGKLVLWTVRPGLELSSIAAVVRSPQVHRLAVANPKLAPYGRAAEEALAKLNLAAEAEPKIVFGETISQTAQFVSSGNADAGFVALSLVTSPNLREKGRWIDVPADLYAPIAQGAVLTTRGAANPGAVKYVRFLATPEARAVFAKFGYGLP